MKLRLDTTLNVFMQVFVVPTMVVGGWRSI
jgi:hypothetical protein